MVGLLERYVASIENRLVLLAPRDSGTPAVFENAVADPKRRNKFLQQVQRLRGSVYLEDGAVSKDHLTTDGRHQTPEDDRAWHLLMLDAAGRLTACVWFREHAPAATIEDTRVSTCPMYLDEGWRDVVRRAIESDVDCARRESLRYVELGGWAVARQSRCTPEGILLALGAYSLGRLLGGAIGITNATVRHCSSTILRRLGGAQLNAEGTPIPPYYDPQYDCTMELLRFDSRRLNPRYAPIVELLKNRLSRAFVLADRAMEPVMEAPGLRLASSEAEAAA